MVIILHKNYASNPSMSRGRLFNEIKCDLRSDFQRDRDRILHSAAFRRLEYKTQVFVNHEGDHYRTRLTHSLEVAQIARSVSRILGINEDLAEALALAHDLGHPPFGHAGEDALNEAMREFGGFDHNAHTIKILTNLEHRYADFNGLNMSWETLEGIAKHNGPLIGINAKNMDNIVPKAILEFNEKFDLALDKFSSLEAQVASLADDIAYNNHDIEDGLRANLFQVEQLFDLPIVGEVFKGVINKYGKLEQQRLIHESIRRLMKKMIEDLVEVTKNNIVKYNIKSSDDIRNLHCLVADFSEEMVIANTKLKEFLFRNVYKHYKINRMTSKAKRVIKELFYLYFNEPECLPTQWRQLADGAKSNHTAQVVSDFIAGMTDRFAFKEHGSLYDLSYNK
jgi:dGTPase